MQLPYNASSLTQNLAARRGAASKFPLVVVPLIWLRRRGVESSQRTRFVSSYAAMHQKNGRRVFILNSLPHKGLVSICRYAGYAFYTRLCMGVDGYSFDG